MEFDPGLHERLVSAESDLQALRHQYDDLRRAHERVVQSPGWRILARIDAALARIPVVRRAARAAAARLARTATRKREADGWVPRIAISATEPEQLAVLRSSPFLDEGWYRDHNADLPPGVDVAQHYLRYGGREGRRAGPLFNTQWYLASNPDVAAGHLNPLVHFHLAGAREGRTGWTSGDLLSWLAPAVRDPSSALARTSRPPGEPSFLDPGQPVALYVSSEGNFFFRDLAELLATGLRDAGHAVELRSQTGTLPGAGETALVMAPHEFYYLGAGIRLAEEPAFHASIPIGTEQWQTQWFARALPFMLRAGRMLDINLQSADAFARLGLPCRHLALGYTPTAEPYSRLTGDWRAKPLLRLKHVNSASLSAEPRALHERPIDVLFVGALSSRRSAIFADLAPALAPHDCFLHLTDMSVPLRADAHVDSELFTLLARNSKVLLNVHHSEMPYFEWQRMVLYGAWQRCVVLTETSFDVPFLRNGEHFAGVPTADLGRALGGLLAAIARGDAGPQRMADAALAALRDGCGMPDCIARI